MPDPAPTSKPAPTPTPAASEGFDPYEFWILHKTRIIAFAGLLAVALGGYGLFSLQQSRTSDAAKAAYAKAKTADDFRKVASEYASLPTGGNAQLSLASLLREEGKLDEANTTLRAFIDRNPQHLMLAGAWLALAENAETAGKVDEGLAGYQKVLTTFPSSFAAPLALLGQARLQKTKGQNDLAKRSYEQVIAQYQGTPFHMEAQRELATLNKITP